MNFCRNLLPTGKNPLKIEEAACTVQNNRNSGVVVTFPKGYYQFKISYSYQQFDNSNEGIYYRDSTGKGHQIGAMYAGRYEQSPGYTVMNLILDISLFETPEALKNKTSFSLYFSPNSRDPHFNSFSAEGLRRVGGGKKSPLFKGFFAPLRSEKRWLVMGFSRNILPAGNKSPYPAGYELKKGTLCTGSATITAAMLKGCIPLSVKVTGTTGNGTVASRPMITTNLGSVQIYNVGYSGSGMYSGPVNGVYDLEMMFEDFLNITQVSFDDNLYGLYNRSITVVKWLEPKGGANNA